VNLFYEGKIMRNLQLRILEIALVVFLLLGFFVDAPMDVTLCRIGVVATLAGIVFIQSWTTPNSGNEH
jgi:mannose/fructose/N-acetylgalactosamine-specific phosphotransferase system component IIC